MTAIIKSIKGFFFKPNAVANPSFSQQQGKTPQATLLAARSLQNVKFQGKWSTNHNTAILSIQNRPASHSFSSPGIKQQLELNGNRRVTIHHDAASSRNLILMPAQVRSIQNAMNKAPVTPSNIEPRSEKEVPQYPSTSPVVPHTSSTPEPAIVDTVGSADVSSAGEPTSVSNSLADLEHVAFLRKISGQMNGTLEPDLLSVRLPELSRPSIVVSVEKPYEDGTQTPPGSTEPRIDYPHDDVNAQSSRVNDKVEQAVALPALEVREDRAQPAIEKRADSPASLSAPQDSQDVLPSEEPAVSSEAEKSDEEPASKHKSVKPERHVQFLEKPQLLQSPVRETHAALMAGSPYDLFSLDVTIPDNTGDEEEVAYARDDASQSDCTSPRSRGSTTPKSNPATPRSQRGSISRGSLSAGSTRGSAILADVPGLSSLVEDENEPEEPAFSLTGSLHSSTNSSSAFERESLTHKERQDYIAQLEQELTKVRASDRFASEEDRDRYIKELEDSIKFAINPQAFVKAQLELSRSKRKQIFDDSAMKSYTIANSSKRDLNQNSEGFLDKTKLDAQDPRRSMRSSKIRNVRAQFDLERYLQKNPPKPVGALTQTPKLGGNSEIPRIYKNYQSDSFEKHWDYDPKAAQIKAQKSIDAREKTRKDGIHPHFKKVTDAEKEAVMMQIDSGEIEFTSKEDEAVYFTLNVDERATCFALPTEVQQLYLSLKTSKQRMEFIEQFLKQDGIDFDTCSELAEAYIKDALMLDSNSHKQMYAVSELYVIRKNYENGEFELIREEESGDIVSDEADSYYAREKLERELIAQRKAELAKLPQGPAPFRRKVDESQAAFFLLK
jgi:hypothetical protein